MEAQATILKEDHGDSSDECDPPLSMEAQAELLKQLKEDQKQFKKDHKDVFDENRSFNKSIKKASDALIECMKKNGVEVLEHDGMEFEVKVNRTEKHDLERIGDLVTDTEALTEYLNDISTERAKVMTRRPKKQKTG